MCSPKVTGLTDCSAPATLLEREPGLEPGVVTCPSASVGPLVPSLLTLGLRLGGLYGEALLSKAVSMG